ncbi:MAG: hypothetical protein J1E29_01400 [Duncaniella sp.]|nr:hypothetical protein [Duncaniella sp.]
MKTLSLISNAALARILQEAIVEQVPLHIIQCINRYAMTLSTERIPQNIQRKEAFCYYKEQIDLAAARSARARAAAAKRKTAGVKSAEKTEVTVVASTPKLPVVSIRDVSATARCPRRHSAKKQVPIKFRE